MRRATAAVHCTGHGMRIGLYWAGPGDCARLAFAMALPTPAPRPWAWAWHCQGHGVAVLCDKMKRYYLFVQGDCQCYDEKMMVSYFFPDDAVVVHSLILFFCCFFDI